MIPAHLVHRFGRDRVARFLRLVRDGRGGWRLVPAENDLVKALELAGLLVLHERRQGTAMANLSKAGAQVVAAVDR